MTIFDCYYEGNYPEPVIIFLILQKLNINGVVVYFDKARTLSVKVDPGVPRNTSDSLATITSRAIRIIDVSGEVVFLI